VIAIVSDSTCDLPTTYRPPDYVAFVPAHILFGTEAYLDGVTIDASTFYRRIVESDTIPTTSQASVGEITQIYRGLAAQGADQIVSIHISDRLSGFVTTATMAASEVAGEVDVHVVDSATGSVILGYMVMEASAAIEAGHSVEDIVAMIDRIREKLTIVLAPLNLEFLQKSGRVNRMQGAVGALLNIKPIIELKQGSLEATQRVRSRRKALEKLVEITVAAHGEQPVNLAVAHAGAPEDAQHLLDLARQAMDDRRVFTADLGLGITAHLGPGTIGLGAYPANLGMLANSGAQGGL
jgi:DegV family protein with EDD domain